MKVSVQIMIWDCTAEEAEIQAETFRDMASGLGLESLVIRYDKNLTEPPPPPPP